MIEGIYYTGTVVKVFSQGKNGFIRLITGEDVFFNRSSFNSGTDSVDLGDIVTLRVTESFDEAKGRMKMLAVCIERA